MSFKEQLKLGIEALDKKIASIRENSKDIMRTINAFHEEANHLDDIVIEIERELPDLIAERKKYIRELEEYKE